MPYHQRIRLSPTLWERFASWVVKKWHYDPTIDELIKPYVPRFGEALHEQLNWKSTGEAHTDKLVRGKLRNRS